MNSFLDVIKSTLTVLASLAIIVLGGVLIAYLVKNIVEILF